MPKYSIVIPSFNAAPTIGATLESVVNQTFRDFEILLIDGGSTDDTLTIAERYRPFISYQVSERDKGIYDAMNKGMRQVKGQYIIFLGADDVFHNHQVLSDADPFLKEEKVYYGQSYFVNKRIVYDGKFHAYKFALRNICHQAIFYPAGVLKQYEFDLRYPLLADYHLNLLLWKQKVKFEYINIIVTNFYDGGASAVAKDEYFEQNKIRLIQENLGLLPSLYARFRRFIFPVQKVILGWLRRNLQPQQQAEKEL